MVQPNTKIFPVAYISPSMYSDLEPKINELAKRTKTKISYNFVQQYFDITGRSQQSCDDTSKIIEDNLIRELNSRIGGDMFEHTFPDFETLLISVQNSPSTSTTVTSSPDMTRIKGRPLNLDEVDKEPSTQRSSGRSDRRPYYNDTESDGSDSDDDEIVETFTFAKNIQNPKDVLTGPPVNNAKPDDYLRIIGNDTNTECCLLTRQIKIVGTNEESVKEALERFRNLQTIYKRRKKGTTYVPCVHYPTNSPEFGLFFCNLERYAQKDFVSILQPPGSPLYVILPAFKNNAGQYERPRELLDAAGPQVQRQQEDTLSLDERMRLASLQHSQNSFGNSNAGMAPDQRPLWGENQGYVMRPSASHAQRQARQGTPPPQHRKEPADDFPALPTAPPRVAPKQKNTRRVMRLTSQKSSAVGRKAPPMSNTDFLREYNHNNIKSALEDGLNAVRGYKGDIKLTARIGKVLWTNVNPNEAKKIWNVTELKDILMENLGFKPVFSNVATFSDEIMTTMSQVLPSAYSYRSQIEIHASARNQPIVPYQPVVMYMFGDVVEIAKVVTGTNTITEVDWVTLDRKFDFQMSLKTEQRARADVKPYSTFIKKVSVHPQTHQITFENVPDFLEVDYILRKQTTIYRLTFPFLVEITRVEKIPLSRQRFKNYGIEKILGDTGKGEVWYDMEVICSSYDPIFKKNQDLPVGKLASWTVPDILGSDPEKPEALTEYIRLLLMMIEKFEGVLG